MAALAQEKQRDLRATRPQMKAPGPFETELPGIAAHLKNDERQRRTARRLLRRPERLLQPPGRDEGKRLRRNAERLKAHRIRKPRLRKRRRLGDPENRT